MIKKLKYTEQIDRYQSHEMSADEAMRFEGNLLTNKVLAKEFGLEQEMDLILREDKVIDFRKKILDYRHHSESRKKTVSIVRMGEQKWYMAAASLAFIMVLGGVLFFTMPGNNSNDNLFKKYYSTENVLEVARSGDANIVEAVIKFQEKDYKAATKLFSTILKNEPTNTAARFYEGISCIETAQLGQAVKSFQQIISEDNSFYIEHAEWYLGLCYLKQNDTNKAVAQFEKIASQSRNYHKGDAQQLLARLQKK
jgi:hypothetical protein